MDHASYSLNDEYLTTNAILHTYILHFINETILDLDIVKLRQGSGKDRQGMAVKAKGLKA